MLHRLCKSGELRHWKFTRGRTGQLFVMPDEARSALDSVRQHAAARPAAAISTPVVSYSQIEGAVLALSEINNGISLIHATLERLASAVESIATQPKTPQQELLHTFNGNGFHS